MTTVILVIHMMLAVAMVVTILLQRSEGGALGIGGGGGGGMSGLMTGRATANLLTRTTAVLAALFIATSLTLAYLAGHREQPTSIIDEPTTSTTIPAPIQPPAGSPEAQTPAAEAPVVPKGPSGSEESGKPEAPAAPKGPSVPLAK